MSSKPWYSLCNAIDMRKSAPPPTPIAVAATTTNMSWTGGFFSWIRRQFTREPRILTREQKKAMRRDSKKHRKAA